MNYGLGGQKGSLTLTKVGPLFNVVNSCIHLDTATIRIQEEKREGIRRVLWLFKALIAM